jgi:hypothetical protein
MNNMDKVQKVNKHIGYALFILVVCLMIALGALIGASKLVNDGGTIGFIAMPFLLLAALWVINKLCLSYATKLNKSYFQRYLDNLPPK